MERKDDMCENSTLPDKDTLVSIMAISKDITWKTKCVNNAGEG